MPLCGYVRKVKTDRTDVKAVNASLMPAASENGGVVTRDEGRAAAEGRRVAVVVLTRQPSSEGRLDGAFGDAHGDACTLGARERRSSHDIVDEAVSIHSVAAAIDASRMPLQGCDAIREGLECSPGRAFFSQRSGSPRFRAVRDRSGHL